jgi:hypothetical protein
MQQSETFDEAYARLNREREERLRAARIALAEAEKGDDFEAVLRWRRAVEREEYAE